MVNQTVVDVPVNDIGRFDAEVMLVSPQIANSQQDVEMARLKRISDFFREHKGAEQPPREVRYFTVPIRWEDVPTGAPTESAERVYGNPISCKRTPYVGGFVYATVFRLPSQIGFPALIGALVVGATEDGRTTKVEKEVLVGLGKSLRFEFRQAEWECGKCAAWCVTEERTANA